MLCGETSKDMKVDIRYQTMMKPQNMNGSWSITLCKDGKRSSYTISHLVAQAFLFPSLDIQDFSIVRHVDGDISNCHADNLEVYFQPTAAGRVANIA